MENKTIPRKVKVRDTDTEQWEEGTLLAVVDHAYKYIVLLDHNINYPFAYRYMKEIEE